MRKPLLPAGLIIVGAVGGALVTIGAYSWCRPHQIPEGLGQLLSGIGTCAGVLLAAITYERWESRHRKERHAVLSEEALDVAAELYAALQRAVADFWNEARGSDEAMRRVIATLTSSTLVQRIDAVRRKLGTALDSPFVEPFQKLAQRRATMVAMLTQGRDKVVREEKLREYFGSSVHHEVYDEFQAVVKALRPLAFPT